MTIAEILEKIVSTLEDLEDAKEMKQASMIHEETVPWEIVKKDLNQKK